MKDLKDEKIRLLEELNNFYAENFGINIAIAQFILVRTNDSNIEFPEWVDEILKKRESINSLTTQIEQSGNEGQCNMIDIYGDKECPDVKDCSKCKYFEPSKNPTNSKAEEQASGEMYKKVYIKSEADLPKELRNKDGLFMEMAVCKKDGSHNWWIFNPQWDSKLWMENVEWYLLPVPQSGPVTVTNKEVSIKVKELRQERLKGKGNMGISRMTLGEIEWMNLCMELAQWMRSKLTEVK